MPSLQEYALPPRDLQYYANGQNGGDCQAGEFPLFASCLYSYQLHFHYTFNCAKPQWCNLKLVKETPKCEKKISDLAVTVLC